MKVLILFLMNLILSKCDDYYNDSDCPVCPISCVPQEIEEKFPEAPATWEEFMMAHLVETILVAILVVMLSTILGLVCCLVQLRSVIRNEQRDSFEMIEAKPKEPEKQTVSTQTGVHFMI